MKIILKRCASQEEFALGVKLPHNLGKLTIFIFYFMSLVNNDIVPFNFF